MVNHALLCKAKLNHVLNEENYVVYKYGRKQTCNLACHGYVNKISEKMKFKHSMLKIET